MGIVDWAKQRTHGLGLILTIALSIVAVAVSYYMFTKILIPLMIFLSCLVIVPFAVEWLNKKYKITENIDTKVVSFDDEVSNIVKQFNREFPH